LGISIAQQTMNCTGLVSYIIVLIAVAVLLESSQLEQEVQLRGGSIDATAASPEDDELSFHQGRR
jgi:hypothetical protein